jgi:hypothetical protein
LGNRSQGGVKGNKIAALKGLQQKKFEKIQKLHWLFWLFGKQGHQQMKGVIWMKVKHGIRFK